MNPFLEKLNLSMAKLGFVKGHRFAVAVSGGADSMALALSLKKWCDAHHSSLVAVTINHGLRVEAGRETDQVKQWLSAHGIRTEIITLAPFHSSSGLQENARQARYDALVEFCVPENIHHLFVAHHGKDQIETMLQRLVSGSGLDGLRGMDAQTQLDEKLTLVRPLLGFDKSEILDFLNEQKQVWIEDPSNTNEDFTRIRLRKIATELSAEGLDAKRMDKLSQRLKRSIDALDFYTEQAFDNFVTCYETGYLTVNRNQFLLLPDDIQLRLLIKIMHLVSGKEDDYLRLKKLESLHDDMKQGGLDKKTLMGCIFDFTSTDQIIVFPEVPKASNYENGIWDSRFIVSGSEAMKVRLFQESDVAFFKENADKSIWNATPVPVRMSLPVFYSDNGMILGNPLLGYGPKELRIKHRFPCFYTQKS